MTHLSSRRRFLYACAGVIAAPHVARAARAAVTFATNWFAQGEHGGHYQALETGLYRAAGLDVTLVPGGPRTSHAQSLLAGKIDLRMGASSTALNALAQGVPLVTCAAFFQKDPQIIMAHPDAGIETLADLPGKTILISQLGRVSFWPWLKNRYQLRDENIRPYTFNMAPLLTRQADAQQGYLTSEPYAFAKETGRQPRVFLLADHGLPGYTTTLETTRHTAENRPDMVQRFIDASIDGWKSYLHDDPEPAHVAILRDNPQITATHLTYSRQAMIDHGIVESGDSLKEGIGAMTHARWQDHLALMVRAGVHPPGLNLRQAYTLRFVNKGRGL